MKSLYTPGVAPSIDLKADSDDDPSCFAIPLPIPLYYFGKIFTHGQVGTVIHDGKELVERRQYLMEVEYINMYNQYKQSNNILETLGQGKLNMEKGRSASVHAESQSLNRMLNDLLKLKRQAPYSPLNFSEIPGLP